MKRRMITYGNFNVNHRKRNRILHNDANTTVRIVSEIESMKIAAFRMFGRKIKKDSYSKLDSVRELCRKEFKKLNRMGLSVPVSLL